MIVSLIIFCIDSQITGFGFGFGGLEPSPINNRKSRLLINKKI
jgi:hypothetical protein